MQGWRGHHRGGFGQRELRKDWSAGQAPQGETSAKQGSRTYTLAS